MPEAFKVLSGRWPRLHSHKAPQTSWMVKITKNKCLWWEKAVSDFLGPQILRHINIDFGILQAARYCNCIAWVHSIQDFVEKALDCRACWDLQDYIPDCSTAELLVLTLQIKWRWVVHGSSSRLLFVCLWGTWANFHRSCILSVYIDHHWPALLKKCSWSSLGELQTETQIYGKSASWTRARGHSSLRRIQHSGTFGSWTYSNMSNEMGGLCKSREIGRVSTSRKFWTPKWWISGGPKALDATVSLAGHGVAARKPCPATHVPGPEISSIDCGWLLGRLDANSGDMLDSVRYCSGTAAHGSTIHHHPES